MLRHGKAIIKDAPVQEQEQKQELRWEMVDCWEDDTQQYPYMFL